jgi:DHA1 family tetracycline resistance protein-like MFS transporter
MKRSPLLVIFVTIFIDLVGFGIVIPVLPFYVESSKFNATPRAVGLLFASYSVMQLIFSPILGRLSDRFGRRPVLLLSLIGTGIGFLVMGFATTLWMLFAGRILDGITGGNISTAQAYIADVTTPEERAKGMGIVGAAFGLGFIFGPPIGGILSRWGIAVPFLFAAGLAFANAILLYFTLPETVTADHPARVRTTESRWTLMRRSLKQARLAFVLLIYFLFVVAFSIMTTTFALYTMHRFGYDAEHNGYLFLLIGSIAAVVQGTLIGKLAKRFGEMPLVIVGALMFTISLAILPLVGPQTGGLAALLAICGVLAVGNSLATPALTSLSSKSVGRSEQGSVLGVTQSAASLARIVGPLLAAFLIYSATGPKHISDGSIRATFWAGAAIMFIAFLAAVYFLRSHAKEIKEPEIAAVGTFGRS